MDSHTLAAIIFTVLILFVIIFQLALALGAPWGEFAMGGKFPGKMPHKMRLTALVQIILLAFIALIVLVRADFVYKEYFEYSRTAIWGVVAFSLLGAILNTITPSKKERILWAPVSIMLFICGVIVAIS